MVTGCDVLRRLRMHLWRTLVVLCANDFFIELFLAAIWLLLVHHVVMHGLGSCHEWRTSLDVARRVVRVRHPRYLLRFVRVELLDGQLLALQPLLLQLYLLDQLDLIFLALVVLHEVAGRILDHEVLRFVLGALGQRLMLRLVVLMQIQGLNRKAEFVQVMALQNLHLLIQFLEFLWNLLSFSFIGLDQWL